MDSIASGYTLSCAKEDFKFSSAHFVAHGGGREKLHGHNYRLYVSLQAKTLGSDGCVMDFAELKKVVRALCKCVFSPLLRRRCAFSILGPFIPLLFPQQT